MTEQPSERSGFFKGDRLELGLRYAYRPEVVPTFLSFLGVEEARNILEVGCGSGFIARLLAQNLAEVSITGLDTDLELLTLALEMQKRDGLVGQISLSQGDGFQLPFPDNCFDLVTSHRML